MSSTLGSTFKNEVEFSWERTSEQAPLPIVDAENGIYCAQESEDEDSEVDGVGYEQGKSSPRPPLSQAGSSLRETFRSFGKVVQVIKQQSPGEPDPGKSVGDRVEL